MNIRRFILALLILALLFVSVASIWPGPSHWVKRCSSKVTVRDEGRGYVVICGYREIEGEFPLFHNFQRSTGDDLR